MFSPAMAVPSCRAVTRAVLSTRTSHCMASAEAGFGPLYLGLGTKFSSPPSSPLHSPKAHAPEPVGGVVMVSLVISAAGKTRHRDRRSLSCLSLSTNG